LRGSKVVAGCAANIVERTEPVNGVAMPLAELLDDVGRDTAGCGLRLRRGLELPRRFRRLRPNQRPAEDAWQDGQTLPDGSRPSIIEGVHGCAHHHTVRNHEVLEALRDAPSRAVGLPVQRSSVEAAERRLRESGDIVQPLPHLGQ